MKRLKNFSLERAFWITALVLLAFSNPHAHHFTLCPLANLGFDDCPGCGLGRSISAFMHGHLKESFQHHWFGIPAFIIMMYRLYQLTIENKKRIKIYTKEDL